MGESEDFVPIRSPCRHSLPLVLTIFITKKRRGGRTEGGRGLESLWYRSPSKEGVWSLRPSTSRRKVDGRRGDTQGGWSGRGFRVRSLHRCRVDDSLVLETTCRGDSGNNPLTSTVPIQTVSRVRCRPSSTFQVGRS